MRALLIILACMSMDVKAEDIVKIDCGTLVGTGFIYIQLGEGKVGRITIECERRGKNT
jgi:hypothetical protein